MIRRTLRRLLGGAGGDDITSAGSSASKAQGAAAVFGPARSMAIDGTPIPPLGVAEGLMVPQWAAARREAAAQARGDAAGPSYKPALERRWVAAPRPVNTTVATRRDWFRVMQFNMLSDSWTLHEDRRERSEDSISLVSAPAVMPVDIKSPRCRGAADADAGLPLVMSPAHRRKHLLDELRHHDPDIVTLNEVPLVEFRGELWRKVRALGFGMMFVSAVRHKELRRRVAPWLVDDTNTHASESRRFRNALLPAQDMGTCILFHKGRFVPVQQAGLEFPSDIPYVHLCGLRDRVTNMTVFLAAVQLKAGRGSEAAQQRRIEARKILEMTSALRKHGTETAHGCHMVMGDLNCFDIEEPCVQAFRDDLSSAYDLVGGPRWTAWFHMRRGEGGSSLEDEGGGGEGDGTVPDSTALPWSSWWSPAERPKRTPDAGRPELGSSPSSGEKGSTVAKHPLALTSAEIIAQMRRDEALMEAKGVVKTTSDFVFYDSAKLSVLRVLDVPKESAIDAATLLPNEGHPSHHIPLVADMCFNTFYPKV